MTIYEQVLTFIHRPEPESFHRLALAVFRHQFETVCTYRRYCESRGVEPGAAVRTVDDVPAVSSVAFKYADLSIDGAARLPGAAIFLTSGTTQGPERRGRHIVARPEIYRASAIAHLRTMLFPDAHRMSILALHPTADAMPESSLATMIGWCIDEFAARSQRAAARDSVNVEAAIAFLGDCALRREPVCILGTTAAFAALFSGLRSSGVKLRLAPGSRMMDTGGPKGQAVPMQASEVIAQAGALLAVSPAMVINEYGMTELCSQLYDATAFNCPGASEAEPRDKIPPPWLRVTARDPVTLLPKPDGEIGLLAFFDLANVGSVSAVMTEDLGWVERGRVRVLGRTARGETRGCALGIAQFSATEAAR
ncbi:MAG: hypothetical protein ACREQH_13885 [Candidatus Binatus sp.]